MKSFIQNINRSESSIDEGYIMLQCFMFFPRCLHDVETKFTRQMSSIMQDTPIGIDNGLAIFDVAVKPLRGAFMREFMEPTEWC